MGKQFSLFSGISFGAGLMYLLDPVGGKRRRAYIRDRIAHLITDLGDNIEVGLRDMRNRFVGLIAATRSQITGNEVLDEVLEARVRAKMGHYVTHPAAIQVEARDGRIILSGPILVNQVEPLLSALILVQGIKDIENRMQVYRDSSEIPSLQGGQPQSREGVRPGPQRMPPATRLLLMATSTGVFAYGLLRRGMSGIVLAAAGIALFAKSLARRTTQPAAERAGRRRGVTVQKTITVNAPIDQVFDFWSNFENFPRFMSHLREVRDLGEGRSYWRAVGPAGMLADWGALITKMEPREVLAWRSVPGSQIENEGRVQFEPRPEGGTRIHVEMSYAPPAGAFGHWIASLFGSDPRSAMNDDLLRFKSLIEEGKTTAHGRELTMAELAQRREGSGQQGAPAAERAMEQRGTPNEAAAAPDEPRPYFGPPSSSRSDEPGEDSTPPDREGQ